MNRKILLSSLAIAAAATAIGGGTFASFSDDETAGPASVTAGTLDLKVSGTAGDGMTITNAKPGDTGTENFYIENYGSLPGTLHVYLVKDADLENGIGEPETEDGDTTDPDGELDQNIELSFNGHADLGDELATMAVGDVYEVPAYWGTNVPANFTSPTADNQPAVVWKIPAGANDVIQSDSLGFHFEFTLEQA